MRRILSANLAGKILLGAFALMLVMHVLILLQIVPSDIVWGGQIKDDQSNLLTLEIIAISVTLVFFGLIAAKMRLLKSGKSKKAINISMWVILAYLLLNTIGNLASGITVENLIFSPVTLIMALCTLRLAIEK